MTREAPTTPALRRLAALAAASLLMLAVPGPDAAAGQAVPDRYETAQLVWTTMIAIDQADRSGNYTVLRDLAAPAFRNGNDAARLAAIFANIRVQALDLGRTVLLAPVLDRPPEIQQNGLLRISGQFPFRPVGVGFDLQFQNVDGRWLLFGVTVAALNMPAPPARETAPAPAKKKP